MKALLWLAAATMLSLGVVAIAVGPGHDTTIFVSPPEVVAEEFVRKLATGRYDRAVDYLAYTRGAEAMVTVQAESLRHQAGKINDVEGTGSVIDGDRATAKTTIRTERAGQVEWEFTLTRQDGVWRISEWQTD